MRTHTTMLTLTFCFFVFLAGIALAGETDSSGITTLSPKNGNVVSSTVEVTYELTKGTLGNYLHAFVADTYQKGFKRTLNNLDKGKSEITIKAANANHDVLAGSDAVIVEVK